MTWVIRGVVQQTMEEQIKEDWEKIDRSGLQRILNLVPDRLERPPLAECIKQGERPAG